MFGIIYSGFLVLVNLQISCTKTETLPDLFLFAHLDDSTFRQPDRGGGNGNLTAGTGFGPSLSRTSSRRKAKPRKTLWTAVTSCDQLLPGVTSRYQMWPRTKARTTLRPPPIATVPHSITHIPWHSSTTAIISTYFNLIVMYYAADNNQPICHLPMELLRTFSQFFFAILIGTGCPTSCRPGLGWLWFGFSTILPSSLSASAKFPLAQAELGWQWTNQNLQVSPTQSTSRWDTL